jgi:hypothetical protein
MGITDAFIRSIRFFSMASMRYFNFYTTGSRPRRGSPRHAPREPGVGVRSGLPRSSHGLAAPQCGVRERPRVHKVHELRSLRLRDEDDKQPQKLKCVA